MSFSTEIEKPNTIRHTLVRLTPARYIGGDLSFVSGTTYQMTFPYPLEKLERNGAALTKVTTLSGNDQWTHDESSGLLQVRLASAPSVTTNVIVAFYFIFLSSGTGSGTYAPETPTDGSSTKRLWEPRLLSPPTTDESLSDIFYGTFSFSASSVEIANADHDFEKYLGQNDSFRQKDIRTWIVVNSEYQEMPIAKAMNIQVNDVVTIDALDVFSALNQPAYMGDSASEAIFFKASGSYPNMNPSDQFKPVPFIFGRTIAQQKSAADFFTWTEYIGPVTTAIWNLWILSDLERNMKAVCTNYSVYQAASNLNREWTIARTSGDFKQLDFGTPTGNNLKVYNTGTSATTGDYLFGETDKSTGTPVQRPAWVLTYSSTPNGNLEVGDTFKDNSGTYFVVTEINAFYVRGYVANHAIGPASGTATYNISVANLVANKAPAIVIYDKEEGRPFYAVIDLDYTLSITTTTGGNKLMKITFLNGFETTNSTTMSGFGTFKNHPGMNTLDVEKHDIFFRVTQASANKRHDKVLQALVEGAGLDIDSTIFGAAGSAFAGNCHFSIPSLGEYEISTYQKYCQDILRSTFGFMKYNQADFQVEYYLIGALSASTEDSENEIIDRSPAIEVDYYDIATEIVATNDHITRESTAPASDVTVTNAKAKYLHGIDQKKYITHVLDNPTTRLQAMLSVLANRRMTYKYSVATRKLTATVGDDVTVSNEVTGLPGGASSVDTKITGIRKSEESVTVTASDLLGI